MAYAALVSLLQTIEEFPRPHVQQITVDLHGKVSYLLGFLDDSSRTSSPSIRPLEGQIRDASCEAQDIIDSHISSQALSESAGRGVGSCFWDIISALLDIFPAIHPCVTCMDLEVEGLQKVIDEFDSILEVVSRIKDGKEEAPGQGNSLSAAGSSRFAPSDRITLVGLDRDLMHIKDRLTGSPSKLDIIPIVGMGGIGKTTLARNLYNDSLIEYYFDVRAWVVVSQDYHIKEMFTSLAGSTREVVGELHQSSVEELALRLHKSLKGRRYLIVMDDVWDTRVWDDVKRYFPDDNNGSRIILTTRQSDVAMYANAESPSHHMSLLSPEASWDLLRKTVFGQKDYPSALEKIGQMIARNCKGLPLAIVVIGGLLMKARDKKQEDWEHIASDVNSVIMRNDGDQFMEILSLSYNYLPHHLKACFLYMGVFPEDGEISVSQLIKLWIAEGFVKPTPPKSFEEVAKDYFNDLNDRSLIQVQRRNRNGRVKTCIIHDMLRELCIKEARDEKFVQVIDWRIRLSPQGRNNQRRMSIHSKGLETLLHPEEFDVSYVRSLLYFYRNLFDSHLLSLPMRCRLLRVLNALTIQFHEFPIGIIELIHLRYLGFSYRGRKKFPESISQLLNLQTLIVFGGSNVHLAISIWKMPKLRHLLFERGFLVYPFPTQVLGKDLVVLENLQTLSGVINFRCTKEIFKIMPNLKKLGVSYIRDRRTKWSSYEFDNFIYLHQLETLKCLFTASDFTTEPPSLITLAFPPSLKKLTLVGCKIPWEKMTVVGLLPNLEVLKLKEYAFEGSLWEPKEGEFTKLKFLLIELNSLEHWKANREHFPQLQHLCLSYCFNLEAIPSEIGEIETLETFELCECLDSAVESAMFIQEEQQSLGNDGLRVRVLSDNEYFDSYKKNTSVREVTT
ncbi:UNVERIFIED_CONTAM: putative late blight resistance proteinR1A-10 [Sesamum radiatum]|uniref:Late blight resistance proteinR1A-10 n=1 Tax=Sesamum radiatum TaxID=300843 RepID=A0AAW2RZE0_SESRA